MISQSAEYALRAVACVAASPGGRPMTARQIARAVRVPAGYLSKILQQLARAGVVASQRGLNGGFVLARPPHELTLLELVHLIDGSRRIAACPLGLPEHAGQLCPLHCRIDRAAERAEAELAGVTVADVLEQSRDADGRSCANGGLCPHLEEVERD